ncbi:hypothetical protein J4404_03835 [Candidatus Woesearchaeota archaeon]|nr:hypothetical protein [Candidatus Woesearchaeota archaeon]
MSNKYKIVKKEQEGFRHKIPIAGEMIEVLRDDLDIDKINLDPENPRIGYWSDSQIKKEFSQDEIAFALREKSDDVNRLKLSIEIHEGIMNPIWIYKKDEKFLVIDGNTRLEIFKDLRRKYPNKDNYRKIPCEILPENVGEKVKNFIRLMQHLRGVNDWEVYERARMLYILWDALSKFSYFVEYENPKIKQNMEENKLSMKDFCKWVGLSEIKRAQDVRNIKRIFEDKKTTEILVRRGYKCAIEELSVVKPEISSKLFEAIEEVLDGLKEMTRMEEEEIIDGDSPQKRILIKNLFLELEKMTNKFKE